MDGNQTLEGAGELGDEQLDTGPSVEERAKALGWAPKEKWRGDVTHWVDAAEFIERGEKLMPVLKANNRQLEEKVVGLERTNQTLAAQVSEMSASMAEFVETQREMMKERLSQQRTEIRRQLREARDAGDDAAIDRLELSLDENTEQKGKLEDQVARAPAAPKEEPENPEYTAWRARNPWFGTTSADAQRRSALAMQLGREAAQQRLMGKEFFAYIDDQLETILPTEAPSRTRKVESGRPSGGGESGGGFDRLPAEAKAQAKKDAARFVGPNKVFKTEAAYFAHFTKLYNGE